MRSRFALVAILLAAFCTRQSEEQRLLKSMSPAKSWTAALPYVSQQRLGNRVPAAFAVQCAEAAEKEIAKSFRTIDQSRAKSELREQLRRELDDATTSVASLKRAFETADARSIAREAAHCQAIYVRLESIGKSYEP
jgi:hypothetical protein